MISHLRQIEATGEYLFHGSNNAEIQVFEPRQAYSFGKPDGEPAVFASEKVEPAIFMAIYGARKCGGIGKPDIPGFGFYVEQSEYDRAQTEKWKGAVYVFERSRFVNRAKWEWRAFEPVEPKEMHKVGLNDLPQHIQVISDEEAMEYRNKTYTP